MEPSIRVGKPPFTYRLVTWLAAKTPDRVLGHVARCGGYVHYCAAWEKRRNYLANLSGCADSGRARPWHAFQNHALNIAELFKVTSRHPSTLASRVTVHGREHIDAALASGRGLILVTMHSGNWELSGLRLAAAGYPITTVAATQLRRAWSDEVKALKERYGIRVVSPEHGMRQLYRDLESNRIVVLHLDGDVFAGGIESTLFGRRVVVPRGPAHLSRVLRAPTAFAYCRRAARARFALRIEALKQPPTEVAAEAALTHEYMRRVEKCIVEDPGQWCIFRKL